MYDGATAQRRALNLKPPSPPNLRDLYSAKFYIANSRARHKIFKILSKILKLLRAANFKPAPCINFKTSPYVKPKPLFKFSRISKFNHKNAIIGAKFLRLQNEFELEISPQKPRTDRGAGQDRSGF
nr:hypothetical protein [uncultured Campylobacter sp.]